MKKIFVLIIVFALIFSALTACSLFGANSEEESDYIGQDAFTLEAFEHIVDEVLTVVARDNIPLDDFLEELYEYFRGLSETDLSINEASASLVLEMLRLEAVRLEASPRPIYTEEQLQALGRVMVAGDLIQFSYDSRFDDGRFYLTHTYIAMLTFVDRDLYFGAVAHPIGPLLNYFANNRTLLKMFLDSFDENGLNYRSINSINDDSVFFAILLDYVDTADGLFGRLNGFTYDPAQEMGFGLPEPGVAQIWLTMPDDQCGWYEIEISEILTHSSNRTRETDFRFTFTDERLPAEFNNFNQVGRSGSPIVQHDRLVGAHATSMSGLRFGDMILGSGTFGGNLAADMRFVQLLVYDENFDAELFRDVPTLELYFNDWSFERSAPNATADTLVGTWDWDSGWYTFNANGTGSREWSGVYAEFYWSTTDSLLFIHLADHTSPFRISITNNYEMTIAGAAFSRR